MSRSLPTSGKVKLCEIWMLFCLFLPFIEVLLITYAEMLNHHNPTERKENASTDKRDNRFVIFSLNHIIGCPSLIIFQQISHQSPNFDRGSQNVEIVGPSWLKKGIISQTLLSVKYFSKCKKIEDLQPDFYTLFVMLVLACQS
jgi:hypothetical protein